LTFFTQGALTKTRNTDSGVTTFGSGISDIDLGLRYRLTDGPVIVAVQGLFKAPYLYDQDADERSYVRAKLDGVHAVGGFKARSNANAPIVTGNDLNPQLPNRFNVGRLEYTLGYKISRSLSGEIAGTTAVYGNNTLKGTNIQVALVASF